MNTHIRCLVPTRPWQRTRTPPALQLPKADASLGASAMHTTATASASSPGLHPTSQQPQLEQQHLATTLPPPGSPSPAPPSPGHAPPGPASRQGSTLARSPHSEPHPQHSGSWATAEAGSSANRCGEGLQTQYDSVQAQQQPLDPPSPPPQQQQQQQQQEQGSELLLPPPHSPVAPPEGLRKRVSAPARPPPLLREAS